MLGRLIRFVAIQVVVPVAINVGTVVATKVLNRAAEKRQKKN